MARILSRTTPALCAFACFLILIVSPATLLADAIHINIQAETIARAFERDTAANSDEQVAPIYQYLELNADNFSIEGLSFHAYGWGRHDLSDSDYFSDQNAGELLYAYLDYVAPNSTLRARLGRQYVFSGIANDAIDGLWLKGSLGAYFSADGYAGQPVGLSTTNGRDGDSIFGGRIAHHNQSLYEVGVSYKATNNDSDTAESMLGFDLAFALPMNANFYGYSTRNLETEGWAEHSYELNINFGRLDIRPFFEYYAYRDYFDTGANSTNPFSLLAQSGEELSMLGFDASWKQSDSLTFGGKFKSYNYDQNQASNFISLLVTWQSEEVEQTQLGAEIGYMNGEAALNDYLLLRLYGYKDELRDQFWVDFVSADVVYALYDRDIFGRSYSLFTSLGTGRSFFNDRLTLRLSGDYSQDPHFDDNLQALLTASFSFDFSL